MKRPMGASTPVPAPVIELDTDRLWAICTHLGISQELQMFIPPSLIDDPRTVRAAIIQHHPELTTILHGVEETFLAATVFLNVALNSVLSQASVNRSTSHMSPTQAREDTTVKKKKEEDPANTHKTTVDRASLIERYSSSRDLLGTRDYGRHYMSRFKVMGTAVRASDVLLDTNIYSTIYHCPSLWCMEELVDMLQGEGYLAFGICDEINKSEECVRYKVICNEPFIK